MPVLEHVPCGGFDHLREELARVEALGGEGLMLRRPGSKYEIGRSNSLLKVKTFHDAEARVIGHAPGTGKHKGRLGALICELGDGVTFNVGTGFSDAERGAPPAIGALITFRYQSCERRRAAFSSTRDRIEAAARREGPIAVPACPEIARAPSQVKNAAPRRHSPTTSPRRPRRGGSFKDSRRRDVPCSS